VSVHLHGRATTHLLPLFTLPPPPSHADRTSVLGRQDIYIKQHRWGAVSCRVHALARDRAVHMLYPAYTTVQYHCHATTAKGPTAKGPDGACVRPSTTRYSCPSCMHACRTMRRTQPMHSLLVAHRFPCACTHAATTHRMQSLGPKGATGLVVVGSGAALPWAVVAAFGVESELAPESLVFMSPASPATLAPPSTCSPAAGSAAAALCAASADDPHNTRGALAALARALAPGGAVYVYDALRDAGRQEGLAKELTLAGFTGTAVQATPSGVVLVRATKPAFELGAKAGLRKKAKPAAPAAPAAAAWQVAGDGDELMDDEDLLTEEDKRPAAKPADPSDCDVGAGKKACKNCSCGRADAEAAGAKVELTQVTVTSAFQHRHLLVIEPPRPMYNSGPNIRQARIV
jgi:hypothetical protein